MNQEIRDQAKPLADEIINKLLYHMRYKMSIYPCDDDIKEMNRITKSIIVQFIGKFVNTSVSFENVTDMSMKKIRENCVHTACWDYGTFYICCYCGKELGSEDE